MQRHLSGRDLRQLAADRSAHGRAGADEFRRCVAASAASSASACRRRGWDSRRAIRSTTRSTKRASRPSARCSCSSARRARRRPAGRRRRAARSFASALYRRVVGPLSATCRSSPAAIRGPGADDMIAVMLHKPNVWLELHGWSPKYIPEALKHEMSRRLKHKVMFGADYPLFTLRAPDQGLGDLGLDEATLRRLFHENAGGIVPVARGRRLTRGPRAARQGRDRRRRQPGHRLRDRAPAGRRRCVRGDGGAATRAARRRRRDDRRRARGHASPSPPTSATPTTASASSRAPRAIRAARHPGQQRRRAAARARWTSSTTRRGRRRSSRT